MLSLSFRIFLLCGAALLAAGTGRAQLLPAIGNVPGQVVGGVLGQGSNAPVAGPVVDRLNDIGGLVTADTAGLLELRRARLSGLVHDHRKVLEADRDGNPVRKGELVAIDPTADMIARARAAGFRILDDEQIETLSIRFVIFAPPSGDNIREGLTRLKRIAPESQIAYDHVFEPAGGGLLTTSGAAVQSRNDIGAISVGMIDGGVAVHPALRNATIEQRGFTPQGARPSGHGTAVASLIVGSDGRFEGALRGASLFVADVYGGDPAAGSAVTIARALGWLASRGVHVINMSLVGPANPLLERAIAVARARGILIVAAVGNDGPAAPPQYPASYPGVIAVTGVDGHDRALPEAGKALHLDFAAPGADMAAALPGSGYSIVRGTSFAAPFVTARLAAVGNRALAIETITREAVKGHGKVGKGIVCETCRVAPRDVGAKR